MLAAKIENFSYQKQWKEELNRFELSQSNINDLPSRCLIVVNDKILAVSKWVSPKRTRSYPYARVYDTFDYSATKIVTIIPLIKDEGKDGDMDYLQWDTISLMSLLNVYVVIGYYESAEKNTRNPNKSDKITSQKFNHDFITQQLYSLTNYHQSALHWNLNQLNQENLLHKIDLTKNAYQNIATQLKVRLHNANNIDKFAINLSSDRKSFMQYSRQKAQNAQNRESLTFQPKESIGIGEKTKITIESYLGGYYFFTIDDVIEKDNILYLIESKHSRNSLLPSSDDIKDGLLKLMLYNNLSILCDSRGRRNFRVILRLTSPMLQSVITLPNTIQNIKDFIRSNRLNEQQESVLNILNLESQKNHFTIWLENT